MVRAFSIDLNRLGIFGKQILVQNCDVCDCISLSSILFSYNSLNLFSTQLEILSHAMGDTE
jgi:hypothetical protein